MKTKQIKGIKYLLFEESDLKEKLSMCEKDCNIVLDYQIKFPQLTITDNEGFCVDGELLCGELGVKDNFNNWLLRDTKGKEGKLIKYRCIENVDFVSILEKSKKPKGGRPTNKITLTLECAKKIAMRQNNERGDLVCDYFILMEKTLKNYEKWIEVRNPEKSETNVLKSELKKWASKNFMDFDSKGIYAREFNLLNKSLTGLVAMEIQSYLKCKDKNTREHLNSEVNKCLYELEKLDIMLLQCNKSFEERKTMIETVCNNQYLHVKEMFK